MPPLSSPPAPAPPSIPPKLPSRPPSGCDVPLAGGEAPLAPLSFRQSVSVLVSRKGEQPEKRSHRRHSAAHLQLHCRGMTLGNSSTWVRFHLVDARHGMRRRCCKDRCRMISLGSGRDVQKRKRGLLVKFGRTLRHRLGGPFGCSLHAGRALALRPPEDVLVGPVQPCGCNWLFPCGRVIRKD